MAADNKKYPFFFIHMSDPQFGMITANRDFQQETELIEKAIAHVNRLAPAFVMLTGDMVNEPGNEAQAREARRILQKLDPQIKLYLTAGNHDIGDTPTRDLLRWYRNYFGKDWYSFEHEKHHFVVINSNLIHQGDNVPEERDKQWDWLKRDLAQTQEKTDTGIIIFMHHPLFLSDSDEEDQYFNIPRQIRKEYLSLFRQYGVKAVFSGHTHQNMLTSDGPMEMIITGAVGMPLGESYSGFRLVEVLPDHLVHKFFGLDAVPQNLLKI